MMEKRGPELNRVGLDKKRAERERIIERKIILYPDVLFHVGLQNNKTLKILLKNL